MAKQEIKKIAKLQVDVLLTLDSDTDVDALVAQVAGIILSRIGIVTEQGVAQVIKVETKDITEKLP